MSISFTVDDLFPPAGSCGEAVQADVAPPTSAASQPSVQNFLIFNCMKVDAHRAVLCNHH